MRMMDKRPFRDSALGYLDLRGNMCYPDAAVRFDWPELPGTKWDAGIEFQVDIRRISARHYRKGGC